MDIIGCVSLTGHRSVASAARPPVEILEKLGERASYALPAKSRAVIRDLIEHVSKFEQVSKDLGISQPTREEIARRLGAQCEHYASQL